MFRVRGRPAWVRRLWLGLVAAVLLLAACDAEIKRVPATQTLIRIEADPDVRAALHSLRVRTSAQQGSAWVERNSQAFAADALAWPVDIVIRPRTEGEADRRFEVIAEALDAAGELLVQARAITGFVLREQRVLVLTLAACGGHSLGFVCEQDPACLGPSCSTCVGDGCAQTPVIEPSDLAQFESPVTTGEAGVDAGPEGDLREAGPGDASDFDARGTDPFDATTQFDAEELPRICDPGSERDDAGTCVDIDECAHNADDCDDEPNACVNAGNGLGFSCACPSGYRGNGRGAEGCADVDECMEQTDACDALVMCNNTPGNYACGSCPPGFSPGTGGTCQDINECSTNNGGCDTSPMATCNNVTGGSNTCSCPTGYLGNGVGPEGCVDEIECTSNNGGCDTNPMATCTNRIGLPNTCGCPRGYVGDGVGAGGCVDENECTTNNGGCDTSPMAACINPTGAPNTCRCPDGYIGNGVGADGCADENECTANNGGCSTSPRATCNNQVGAPNTCTCPSGYSGDGKGAGSCVDSPDCTASSCQHNGQCIEQVNGFSCNCAGTGYSGSNCQIDPCSPDPCGTGLNCNRTGSGTASCVAECAASRCQPGDVCVTDDDCKTGGDSNATCEPNAKVCVTVCDGTTILTETNLEALKFCKEINGDLKVEPDFATLPATALPYLTRIRGSLLALSPFMSPAALSMTFGNLQTVDGEIKFGLVVNLTLLSLPRLTSAGAVIVASMPQLARLSLPQLTTVSGMFAIRVLAQLGQLDIARLSSVGGELSAQALCKLPYGQLRHISTLGTTQTFTDIGCCTTSSDRFGCTGSGGGCACN